MVNLNTPIEKIPRVGPVYQKKLKKLGIKNVQELLFHFPHRYDDFSKIVPISKIKLKENCCIRGKILEIKNSRTWKKRMILTQAIVEDKTGAIKVIWFNQPYLTKNLKAGDLVCLAGKTTLGAGSKNERPEIYLANPAYEKLGLKSDLTHTGRIIPVYPETEGLSSRWLRYILKPLLLKFKDKIPEPLPEKIKVKHQLLPINQAVWQIHFPASLKIAEQSRFRFVFENLFLLELAVLKEKLKLKKTKARPIPIDIDLMKKFTESLPFQLTDSQKKSVWQILKDLEKPYPMSRLLQGDVGSGKTVVATMVALNVAKSGYQTAVMAPTEILAKQHFKEISKLLDKFGVKVALLTGKETSENTRQELLEKLEQGEISVLIGTHALIQEGIKFKNLALVIIDEQHRFGIDQRQALVRGSTRINTQINADNKSSTALVYEKLSYKIRGSIFNVYNTLGSGHKEIVYQKSLIEELRKHKLKFEIEKSIPIKYKDKSVGTYRADLVVDDKVIIELKALPFIGNTEKRQLWSYLKGSLYKLAFLVNFGPKLTIERIVYDSARNLRESAFNQRESAQEMRLPHLLSMTATPIPRTLALTVYGDLDLSLITEMPKNRKRVKTSVINPSQRQKAYDFIREEVKKGRAVFVICPRIEAPNSEQKKEGNEQVLSWNEVKAVKKEYEKLSKEIFPDLKIGYLHGKMKPAEKEKIMTGFRGGKIDILVSTSVVEVGIDIPRATVMMIEGAERFGLSQLHQFRGRVGRANFQSYCFLFSDSGLKKTNQRLLALVNHHSGLELAEKDLKIRGPGELYGKKQWGIPDLAMANLGNLALVQTTRETAKEILQEDPQLKKYPLLKKRMEEFEKEIHFE